MKESIGFIGLGIMGGAMAANVLRAGYDLTVWNLSLIHISEPTRPY